MNVYARGNRKVRKEQSGKTEKTKKGEKRCTKESFDVKNVPFLQSHVCGPLNASIIASVASFLFYFPPRNSTICSSDVRHETRTHVFLVNPGGGEKSTARSCPTKVESRYLYDMRYFCHYYLLLHGSLSPARQDCSN